MRIFTTLLLLALAAGCVKPTRWQIQVPSSQIVSYQSQDHRYVIIVVQDNGVTAAQAKETARRNAAQVTLDNGYRYFSIVSEKQVQVAKSDPGQGSQFPGNLYQELIVEKQFGRETLEREQPSPIDIYPATRIEIECYSEKPFMKNTIDAQAFLNQ